MNTVSVKYKSLISVFYIKFIDFRQLSHVPNYMYNNYNSIDSKIHCRKVFSSCILKFARGVYESASCVKVCCMSSNNGKDTSSKNGKHTPRKSGSDTSSKNMNNTDAPVSSLFKPVNLKLANNADDINIGAELTKRLQKDELMKLLSDFYKRPLISSLALEAGLDLQLFNRAYINFRRFCIESEHLPVDLHVIFSDILQGGGHVDDIFPYFLRHAKQVFPHLECMDDLRNISDLRNPVNWYPEARSIHRKIIYHSGPTNSGKTYYALQHFLTAKSGVYCGPLKMLAVEIFEKSNQYGTPCDLVTGEERRIVDSSEKPANHIACTVEMMSTTNKYDVAVIDEIQMIRDRGRGWAWTRALLGVCATEIHLCGEGSALDLIKDFLMVTTDDIEVRTYKRLTKLTYLHNSLDSLANVKPGDCIVCFNKRDIYNISRQLEKLKKECAIIYGSLPPGAKKSQAARFNDPKDSCKIMVATDAIGMGLNLSIKRIIFYSLMKPTINEKGEKEMNLLTTSQAMQIAGRAGRYGTQYVDGEVTTLTADDLRLLTQIIMMPLEPIERAGLHPTADQIELFSYHLPHATLSNIMDIFVTISRLDNSKYFMCNIDDFKFLADMIEHVPLPIRVRYIFCCAPISKKEPFVCTMFLKFTRQYSRGEPLTFEWLCKQIDWPFSVATTIADLIHLENVYDVFDLYLWLSNRFPDLLPDLELVREMQCELDQIIQTGVMDITRLLTNSNLTIADDTDVSIKTRRRSMDTGSGVHDESDIDSQNNSFTEGLIKSGILTRDAIRRLKREWNTRKSK